MMVSLEVPSDVLDTLREALKTAQSTMRSAWVPNHDIHNKAIQNLINEIDIKTRNLVIPHAALDYSDSSIGKNYDCTCHIAKDHDIGMLTREQQLAYVNFNKAPAPMIKYYNSPEPNPVTKEDIRSIFDTVVPLLSHFTWQGSEFNNIKYRCMCARPADHSMLVMTEGEVDEYVYTDTPIKGN